MVNCLIELLRSGGSYTLLRRWWGSFRATLGRENPLYSFNWSAELLISVWFYVFLLFNVLICGRCLWVLSRAIFVSAVILWENLVCVLVVDLPCVLPTSIAFAHRTAHSVNTACSLWRMKIQKCFVQTWDDHSFMSVCIRIEPLGQLVPKAELSGLSRIIDSATSCQLPLSCHGGSPTLLRVLSDYRVDSRSFIVFREFSVDVFLHCFCLAYQQVFGGLEVTTMIDFLVLRSQVLCKSPGSKMCLYCVGV